MQTKTKKWILKKEAINKIEKIRNEIYEILIDNPDPSSLANALEKIDATLEPLKKK